MNCVFCEIVAGRIPSDKIRETSTYVAFRDLHPVAPTHFLIIPKKHLEGIGHARSEDTGILGEIFFAASELAREEGLDKGYRLVVNSGVEGGQTVHHLHVHVMGGRAMKWPPG